MDAALRHYRGLVYKTALLVVEGGVEDDFDDVVQVLYMKVWYALRRYDDDRSRNHRLDAQTRRDRWVFMCLRNQVKDLQKKRRRGELSLEALAESEGSLGFQSRDSFDAKYLAVEVEVVYADVEDEPLLLPNTLSEPELRVVQLLAADFTQAEARSMLGIEKREMEKVMRAIRLKLADWKPTSAPAELVALPTPAPQPALRVAA